MSETLTMLRSVELALRKETQFDWEFADAVYEDVLDKMSEEDRVTTRSGGHGVNSGLYKAIEEVYDEHHLAGTEVTENSLRNMFVTRRVWPPEERRPDLASFSVHYELRSKDFRARKSTIEEHAAKSKNGRWSLQDLRRWKSEQKPQPFKTFRELFEERVRKAAYQAGKPWHTVAEGDRYALAQVCRSIANEIEAGTFGQDES